MKKIGLYLGSEPNGGGAFQYGISILNAVSTLPIDNYEVLVVYSTLSWGEILKKYSVKVRYVSLSSFERKIALWWRRIGFSTILWRKIAPKLHPFTRKFMQSDCDLWIFPSQDIWAYRIPIKGICAIHDLMHRYENRFDEVSAYGRDKRREFHYSDICKFSMGVLVDSRIGKQHVIESYKVEPSTVHILPFIAPNYIYSHHVPFEFDTRYHLPDKYIFYPAQFWSHKNHLNLIKAINQLKNELPDLKLVLVGAKKDGYELIIKKVIELELSQKIIFLGYVPNDDITEIYRRARALIMPTFFGPTNIPPLEALALGCPMAVSNIYGMPEQVGDAGLLFNPEIVEEIAESIKKLWVDDQLCEKLKVKGLKKSESWSQVQFNMQFETIIAGILSVLKKTK